MENELKVAVTKQHKLLDYINSSLISTLFVFFSFWWITKIASIKNIPRKTIRIIAILFYFTSAISMFICDWLLIYIATQMELNKNTVEKLGYLEGTLIIAYKQINLVEIYNVLLFIGQILKISTVFLLTASWVPFPFRKSGTQIDKDNKKEILSKLSEASLISFTKYYAFFRLPVFIFFRTYQHLFDNDTILFLRSVIFGSEMALCALFLVILKTKYQGILSHETEDLKGNYGGINILIMVLIFDSFFNHILHTLSIPLVFNELTAFIIEKLGFLSEMLCNITLLTLLCPQHKEEKVLEKAKYSKVDIVPFDIEDYKSDHKRMEVESYDLVDVIGTSDKMIQPNN